MKQFTGKGVYGAVAMGKISLFKKQDTVIQRTSVTDTEAEKASVEAAKADLAAAVNENTSAERIEALSDSVASGSYDVSPEMIADSILMF